MEDYPRDFIEFEARFGTEEACRDYLFGLPSAETEGSMLQIIILICFLITEAAFAQQVPNSTPDVRTGFYRGQLVTYEVIDGLAIWDGDIIIGTEHELLSETPLEIKLLAVRNEERLWPNGVIPYEISPDLENIHVHDAIQHWEHHTPIRFVERTNQPNWVIFTLTPAGRRYACSAAWGMIGGQQPINLSSRCGRSSTIHEIGHAVGLLHEHQRHDRDRYIFMSSDAPGPYRQVTNAAMDNGPYDYGSVMHYGGSDQYMMSIPPGIKMRSGMLSGGDIDGINRLYGIIPTRTIITTNPEEILIEVDGETYTSPQSFDWPAGTIHEIDVQSSQLESDHARYVFAKWSDGGAKSHSITASPEATVFIANFVRQKRNQYIADPPGSGTFRFDPPSEDGFYPVFSFFKVYAEPAEGFSFKEWQSWASGNGHSSNPHIGFAFGGSQAAFFTQQKLSRIDTNVPGSAITVDGRWIQTPKNLVLEPGSTHALGLLTREDTGHNGIIQPSPSHLEGERLMFDGWSDGGADTHDVTISEESFTVAANFRKQFLLSMDHHRGLGTVTVNPDTSEGYYDDSSMVQLTAQPNPGWEFVSWLGDFSGSETPKSFIMDSPKKVKAFFLPLANYSRERLVDGRSSQLSFSMGRHWIVVPSRATRLEIHIVNSTPNRPLDLYINYDIWPSEILSSNNTRIVGYESQYSFELSDRSQSIMITPYSDPSLKPGVYFIIVHDLANGGRIGGRITAEVTASNSEIAVNVPGFRFPASLITTQEGESLAPQMLEIRNAGRGILNYQIATDQPWLSVYPNQGSVMDETDTLEIHANPGGMEVGAFEGFITISEQESISGSAPAASVKVPVTLVILPREEPITPPHPTGPAATLPGKPPAPTVSTSTPYSLTVEWTEPENTGTAITDYDVEYREVGSGSFTDAQHEGTGLRATLTGLSPDTVYEVQVRATNATGTGAWSESGEGRTSPLQTGDQIYYFPHLAVGASWQTTITYINYSREEVTCQTDFISDHGTPLMVSFADKGTVPSRTDVLLPGGSVHQETNVELNAPFAPGWARATCSGPVKASLLFRLHNSEGVPIAEGGVNAAAVPATRFVTFAEQGEGKQGTGVAYANPSVTEAVVTFTARDADGQMLASVDKNLSPNGHAAQNMAPLFALSSFTGSLEVTSTAPIVSLSINAEAAPVFSSLPPGELDAAAQGSTTYYFPHLAVGQKWQTTITYINYSSQEVRCQTDFISDHGTPLMVSFADKGTVPSRTDVLLPGGSVHQETNVELNAPFAPGWARATCSGPVKASLLFRLHNSEGVPIAEGGVNAAAVPATRFVTFAEQGEGKQGTGVAYANPSATEAVVTFTAKDALGQTLASVDKTLLSNEHAAQNMAPLFALSSFTGSLEVTSTVPIVSLSINAEAAPVFSSLPPGELDAAPDIPGEMLAPANEAAFNDLFVGKRVATNFPTLVRRKIRFIAIKEAIEFDGKQDLPTKVMIALFGLFAEVERDLISERTKEGLAAALVHESELARNEPESQVHHLPRAYDDGLPSSAIRLRM